MANPTKITFTLPTTNVDGTALAVADITGVKYVILDQAGQTASSGTVQTSDLNLDANGNGSIQLPHLASGSYSVYLQTESVSLGSPEESVPSTLVPFAIAVPVAPNPPTAVSVV